MSILVYVCMIGVTVEYISVCMIGVTVFVKHRADYGPHGCTAHVQVGMLHVLNEFFAGNVRCRG